jgi:hypothetical protein
MCDCSTKPVLVVRDGGEYSSASDFDEDSLALLAADHAGNDYHSEEQIGTGVTDHCESLIVLSTQIERVEQNQRHTLCVRDALGTTGFGVLDCGFFCVLDSKFTRMNMLLQLASDFLDREFFF